VEKQSFRCLNCLRHIPGPKYARTRMTAQRLRGSGYRLRTCRELGFMRLGLANSLSHVFHFSEVRDSFGKGSVYGPAADCDAVPAAGLSSGDYTPGRQRLTSPSFAVSTGTNCWPFHSRKESRTIASQFDGHPIMLNAAAFAQPWWLEIQEQPCIATSRVRRLPHKLRTWIHP